MSAVATRSGVDRSCAGMCPTAVVHTPAQSPHQQRALVRRSRSSRRDAAARWSAPDRTQSVLPKRARANGRRPGGREARCSSHTTPPVRFLNLNDSTINSRPRKSRIGNEPTEKLRSGIFADRELVVSSRKIGRRTDQSVRGQEYPFRAATPRRRTNSGL